VSTQTSKTRWKTVALAQNAECDFSVDSDCFLHDALEGDNPRVLLEMRVIEKRLPVGAGYG